MRYVPYTEPNGIGFHREPKDTIYVSTDKISPALLGDHFVIKSIEYLPDVPKDGDHVVFKLHSVKEYDGVTSEFIAYGLDQLESTFTRKL